MLSCLGVVVEGELVRIRTQLERLDFGFLLEVDVAFEGVGGEHVTGGEPVVIAFEGFDGFFQALHRCLEFGQLFRWQIVDVLVQWLARIDFVLNTVDGSHEDGSGGEVWRARGVWATEFEATGLVTVDVRDTHRSRTVGGAVSEVHRGFVTRNQTAVAVGTWVGEGLDGTTMLEDTTDGVERILAQLGIGVTGEGVDAVFPDGHVAVHAAAVVTVDGLRHKGGGLAMLEGGVLDGILVFVHLVTGGDDGAKLGADFALTCGGHFVVVQLNFEAHGHHVGGHFRADVHQGVLRSGWEVTMLVLNLVTEVVAIVAAGGPRSFDGVDFVESTAGIGGVTDAVEDEEFRLWAEESHVTDARGGQVSEGFVGDGAGIAVITLTGAWLVDVAKETDGGLFAERIDESRIGNRLDVHVRLVDGLPAAD